MCVHSEKAAAVRNWVCYTMRLKCAVPLSNKYTRKDTTEFVNHKEHSGYQLNFLNFTASLSRYCLTISSHILIHSKDLIKVTTSLHKTELPINSSYTSHYYRKPNSIKNTAIFVTRLYMALPTQQKLILEHPEESFESSRPMGSTNIYSTSVLKCETASETNKMAALPVISCFQMPLQIWKILELFFFC